MRLRWVLALLVAAGCGPPTYREPDPEPVELPPRPPESVLRVPPDFTFRDLAGGKQFFFRRYTVSQELSTVRDDRLGKDQTSILTLEEPEDLRLEVITVVDAKSQEERLADAQERAYALGVLQEDWVARGREDMLTYHRDVYERERRMRADLLDERIQYTQRVLEDLKDERFRLNADLVSSRETAGYKAPDGRLEFLDAEIKRRDALLAEATENLELLRYQRALRDGKIGRSSVALHVREWLAVRDLVGEARSGERLVSDIQGQVRPDYWRRPEAAIRYSQGYIEVAATRGTVDAVREYLEQLRTSAQK